MNLPTEIFGDVIVVHAPEELGADHADQFETYVPTLERSRVVLDLDSTELIDSRGLAALLGIQERLQQVGGQVKIAATSFANRKILEITRLERQLEVFENVVDAVRSFQ